jgi:hypothetical protein
MPLSFLSNLKTPRNPIEGLRRRGSYDSLLALARTEEVALKGGSVVGRIEIFKVEGGEFVRSVDWSTATVAKLEDWHPLELMGAVTHEGFVGELVVTTSSGSSEIDDNFRSLLRKNVLFSGRLPVGFYTFRVGR